MSKAFRTKHLFSKYLSNTCSSAEMEELFELLNDEDNLEVAEHSMETIWSRTANDQFPENSDLFNKFKHKRSEQKVIYNYPNSGFSYKKWAVAASIILCLGIFSYQWFFGNRLKLQDTKAVVSTKLNPAVKKIVLSDGSVVVMNKGSHLNYPSKFVGDKREVYLTGEAFFDIKHDAKRPFLVHTGKLVTRVLGTAFNIKTQADEDLIEVTVSRGKVSVSDSKKTLAVLLPNQKISYDANANLYRKEKANAQVSTLWKEEDLVLDNITLEQAVKSIQARYGTSILLANDQIKNCRFTAYFLNTTSLQQVVKVISNLNHLNYNINESGVYTLSGNGCD